MRIKTRVAAVTGGASGLGDAICQRLRHEGVRVFVLDSEPGAGRDAIGVDVRDEWGIDAAMAGIVAEAGRLDICIANAGIGPSLEPATALSLASWSETIGVNLTGAFLTFRAAARQMVELGAGGRLIATCSIAGVSAEPGASAYCASKFGLRGLVESMALELAASGITVNAVAPGETDTPLHASLRGRYATRRGITPAQVRDEMERSIPARRLASPEEIAAGFSYLASEEAAYVTGTVLVIDGGRLLA